MAESDPPRRSLKLMNDYMVGFPLWGDTSLAKPLISADLAAELQAWASQFNRHYDVDEGWSAAAIKDMHLSQGRCLFERLQTELLEDTEATWHVEVDLWEGEVLPGTTEGDAGEGGADDKASLASEARACLEDEARAEMAQDLTCMGQPLEVCVHALRLADDDLDRAMAWLLSPAAAQVAQQMEYQAPEQLAEGESGEPPPDRSEYDTLE